MNALSITPDSTGGGTTYILELVRHLSQTDRHNTYVLFVRADSRHHFDEYGDNFGTVRVPVPPLFSIIFRVMADHLLIPLLAWRYRLDVLFCPGDALPLWVPCASVMVIQNLLHFHRHEVFPLSHIKKGSKLHIKTRIWYYEHFTPRSASKADRIITVSENSKREIVEFLKIDASKVSVVHHGVGSQFKRNVDEQRRVRDNTMSYNLQPDYLLYVGALVPYKNIGNLIAALSILKDRNSILPQLVIAGSDHAGYASHLRTIADTMGVSEQMTLLGYIPHEELPALYRGAKVFILLSLCESFGLPILEAMACGCPVVCSDVSSLPEIAGDAAMLVDPGDPAQVADAIGVLLEDGKCRHRMVAMGRYRAQEFSWDRAASQTLSVIERAAKERQL